MGKRQTVLWIFALATYVFLLGVPLETEAQDGYMFFLKKGAGWEFEVTVNNLSQGKSILTIVNEGARAGVNSTVFSWTFRNALGVSMRMELFYARSPDGIVLSRVDIYKGSSFELSERYDPPVLVLKFPLKVGYWENRSLRVSHKSTEQYHVINTVRKVRVTVPAGTFDAFEIQGQELTGSISTEYWVENVGLIGFKQTHSSGTTLVAQLVRYSHAPYGMLQVGERVFSHRQSWGCATPEFLVEAYRWDAYGPQDRRAVHQLERMTQEKKCVRIDGLQGYIVFKRGDGVQINGKFPPNREVVIWVPIWSVSACHRILCAALY